MALVKAKNAVFALVEGGTTGGGRAHGSRKKNGRGKMNEELAWRAIKKEQWEECNEVTGLFRRNLWGGQNNLLGQMENKSRRQEKKWPETGKTGGRA